MTSNPFSIFWTTVDQYNIPVWIGETGENSNTWFTEAIRLFEKNNIGWSWWPLKKLGNNNPLQIKSNPAYDSLVDYWNGKSICRPPAQCVCCPDGTGQAIQNVKIISYTGM